MNVVMKQKQSATVAIKKSQSVSVVVETLALYGFDPEDYDETDFHAGSNEWLVPVTVVVKKVT